MSKIQSHKKIIKIKKLFLFSMLMFLLIGFPSIDIAAPNTGSNVDVGNWIDEFAPPSADTGLVIKQDVKVNASKTVVELALNSFSFTEDFSTTDHEDAANTTADWNTGENRVILKNSTANYSVLSSYQLNFSDTNLEPSFGDYNGDGYPDAVIRTWWDMSLHFFTGGHLGENYWQSDLTTTFSELVAAAELDDINHDGKIDLLILDTSDVFKAYINQGTINTPNWVYDSSYDNTFSGGPLFDLADLNNDNILDASIGCKTFQGNGPGSSTQRDDWMPQLPGGGYTNGSFCDLDGDGDLDFMYFDNDSTGRYYENIGDASNPNLVARPSLDYTNTIDLGEDNMVYGIGCVGDLNGDGRSEIGIAKNNNVVFLTQTINYSSPAVVQSDVIDVTSKNLATATLNANENKPGNTNIQYYLSSDGGLTWEGPITLGASHTFANVGSDLRWKAILTGDSGNVSITPEINEITIDYTPTEPSPHGR